MEKKNRLSRAYKASKKLAVRAGAAVSTMALTAGTALAQDVPASVDEAATWMNTKGLVAVAVAAAITLIVLGVRGAKLPRQG